MSWAGKWSKKPYLEQFERLKRWHERLIDIQRSLSVKDSLYSKYDDADFEVDTFYAFFMNSYHLKDWLLSSGVVKKKEVEDFINTNLELKICRDLCNGSKHLNLTSPSTRSGPFGIATLHKEYTPIGKKRSYCVLAEGKHDVFDLANRCVAIWAEFLQSKGLL